MRTAFIILSLFASIAGASSSKTKLTILKPTHASALELGTLKVELVSAKDGSMIQSISGKLGDCKDCIRGAAIHNELGIRIEGTKIEDLQISRKQTSKIKLIACPQHAKIYAHEVSCDFALNDRPMKMKISFER